MGALQRILKKTNVQYVHTSDILPLSQAIKRCMFAFAKFRCPELDVNAVLANDYIQEAGIKQVVPGRKLGFERRLEH